jgi:hypothetical protein
VGVKVGTAVDVNVAVGVKVGTFVMTFVGVIVKVAVGLGVLVGVGLTGGFSGWKINQHAKIKTNTQRKTRNFIKRGVERIFTPILRFNLITSLNLS